MQLCILYDLIKIITWFTKCIDGISDELSFY